MKQLSLWLVVRADGTARIRSKRPYSSNLRLDEIAVPLRIDFPDGWGEVVAETTVLNVPGPPAVELMPAMAVHGSEALPVVDDAEDAS